ncbi:hypothetical protein FKM82_027770 [Ascaphus truei]
MQTLSPCISVLPPCLILIASFTLPNAGSFFLLHYYYCLSSSATDLFGDNSSCLLLCGICVSLRLCVTRAELHSACFTFVCF